jgi:hypothetical protein
LVEAIHADCDELSLRAPPRIFGEADERRHESDQARPQHYADGGEGADRPLREED